MVAQLIGESAMRRGLAKMSSMDHRQRINVHDGVDQERDYSADEVEFMLAMDRYKRDKGRRFPTWSEALEVLRGLGYRKVVKDEQHDA